MQKKIKMKFMFGPNEKWVKKLTFQAKKKLKKKSYAKERATQTSNEYEI